MTDAGDALGRFLLEAVQEKHRFGKTYRRDCPIGIRRIILDNFKHAQVPNFRRPGGLRH